MSVSKLKESVDKLISSYQPEFGKVSFYQQTDENIQFGELSYVGRRQNHQFFIINDYIKDLLGNNNISCKNDIIIDQPSVEGVDFVFDTKSVFEDNKDKYDNIKNFADTVSEIIDNADIFSKVEQKGIFINLFLHDEYLVKILDTVLNTDNFFRLDILGGEKFCLDYPSCNMAKQMTVGHLRSAIIGHSLANIIQNLGGNVFRWNYIGDWGTPFGKTLYSLINEYKINGDGVFDDLYQNPTKVLGDLYAKFKDIEDDEKNEQAKNYFGMLEQGDPLLYSIREEFRRLSLIDFDSMFGRLGMQFDTNLGESFAYSISQDVIDALDESGYLVYENNAWIVKFHKQKNGKQLNYIPIKKEDVHKFDEQDLEVMIIKKSDGAGVYATRDLSVLKYRKEKLQADKFYYIVGPEQTLHFQLLFELASVLWDIPKDNMKHISFGLMLFDGKKMSSRGGESIKLSELISSIKDKISQDFSDSSDDLVEKLAISAMIFNDLKNDRQKDVNFDLEQMTRINGDSGVYIQYTYARINSLCGKIADIDDFTVDISLLDDKQRQMMVDIFALPLVLQKSYNLGKPHILCQYILSLAHKFNSFYANSEKIIDMQKDKKSMNYLFLISLKRVFEAMLLTLNMPLVNRI
ncbi:arginine--tRNA ligase [Candidatus Absconditicoccus praedator]|uniref:arginine--tRNA ligase n=1 Tax=Candidatus Absconditicoccus praedator TaxID=2735562 RepID=UPI001E5C80C8|nr:arginine--tRNA ligase [Candidatus Absconditicoccus praedator]UFX83169.1 arginine--tRNA ligase [Candidatus Absconditicoccus praedator]